MDTSGTTRLLLLALSLLCAAGCGLSDEAAAAKARESSKASWALVDYDEHWERLVNKALTIKASSEFHRDSVDSKIALPGASEIAVTGGTMFIERFSGKWAGSDGDKTLSGKIMLQLRDGRTLAVHAVTWG